MRLDPLESAAFSLYQNKGAYALLLGSGTSRSAGIPTGWDIVLDLIRRLAVLRGEEADPDPESWYRECFQEPPAYDVLVEEFAKTPDERSALMRGYVEPSAEDRENNRRVPQAAHHAIARLVAGGYVRAIVTTNFDALAELAIEEAGVVPDVLSTVDQIRGARPLHQARCVVLKVNGDYRDIGIRNTEKELAEYGEELDAYLDMVLAEFGLVVCGWSADYDVALRNAVYRSPSRRYRTYWTAVGGHLREEAGRLVSHRGGETIPIRNADGLFAELADRVESLESAQRPHPLSTAAAVASVKRCLERGLSIELHDLVNEEVETTKAAAEGADLRPHLVPRERAAIVWQQRMARYEGTTERLMHMLATLAFFDDGGAARLCCRAVERLAEVPSESGPRILLSLRLYPALRAMYAAGIAAVASEHWAHLRALLLDPMVPREGSRDHVLTRAIAGQVLPGEMLESASPAAYKDRSTPWSDYLLDSLRDTMRPLIPSHDGRRLAFDTFEYVLALAYLDVHRESSWSPPGAFVWREESWNHIGAVLAKAKAGGASSPLIVAGLFGGDPERLASAEERQEAFVRQVRPRWR